MLTVRSVDVDTKFECDGIKVMAGKSAFANSVYEYLGVDDNSSTSVR